MDGGAWWGCGLWGCKDSDMTKQLTHTYTHTLCSWASQGKNTKVVYHSLYSCGLILDKLFTFSDCLLTCKMKGIDWLLRPNILFLHVIH